MLMLPTSQAGRIASRLEEKVFIMVFDLKLAREDTPGCRNVVHFNNAGASLMPRPVLEAATAYLELESQIGGYEAAERSAAAIARFYQSAASLLNCRPTEIAFIENATRAWDMAFYSIPFKAGDRILTGMNEYASNYIAFLQVARQTGAIIQVIPNDEYGQISIEALQEAINPAVKLIAITHIPTNGGLVNPAAAVGRVARAAGVLYLLDACQSAGQLPLDVKKLGCDFLSATGRKYLRGPRGTGFLYVREELIEQFEPPFLDLHAAQWVTTDRYVIRPDARRFENWETNYAGKSGLTAAIDYALSWGQPETWERIKALAGKLRSDLRRLPGIEICDLGQEQCGIISFRAPGGLEAGVIRQKLSAQNINVSVSRRPSTRLDMEARGLNEVLRASVHYYNTEAELDQFNGVLAAALKNNR